MHIYQCRRARSGKGKEFCAYFGIPYRTMTEWELGHRKLPDYVLRMMTYQVRMEKLDRKGTGADGK